MDEKERKSLISRIQEWDVRNFRKINQSNSGWIGWLKYYTHLGFIGTWVIIGASIAIYSFIVKSPLGWEFFYLFCTNLASATIITLVKLKVGRIRPCHALDGVILRTSKRFFKGPSFPSGHAHYFFSNTLLITYTISKVCPVYLPVVLSCFIIMSALMALSRIFIGVHYPTDVIFAFPFGVAEFFLTVYLLYPYVFKYLFSFLASLYVLLIS